MPAAAQHHRLACSRELNLFNPTAKPYPNHQKTPNSEVFSNFIGFGLKYTRRKHKYYSSYPALARFAESY